MKYLFFSTIPFEHENFPTENEIVDKNLFGNNVGNMFFFNAIVKSLLREDNLLVRYKNGINIDDFDAGILIHANSIRNGTKNGLKMIIILSLIHIFHLYWYVLVQIQMQTFKFN